MKTKRILPLLLALALSLSMAVPASVYGVLSALIRLPPPPATADTSKSGTATARIKPLPSTFIARASLSLSAR